jgi:hypothetical protein
MTGSVTGKAAIYRFRSLNTLNAFTGSFAANTVLVELSNLNDNSSIDKLTTIANKPLLVQMSVDYWVYTAAEVNQILADKWADKDAMPSNAFTYRWLKLDQVGSAAPTGQGIIDAAALQTYHSPTPPGTAAHWTIETN